MTQIQKYLSSGYAVWANANSGCKSIAYAARDLCSGHTKVETFCLARHPKDPKDPGKIDRWIYIHADQLPQLIEETPDWVFAMCEAVRAICTRKRDLIAFYYEDGSRCRIGVEKIPDENNKYWRTLRWIEYLGSVIRSGKGCEDPLMATAIILSHLLSSGQKIECNCKGVGDPTDPVLVAGAIAYQIVPNLGKNNQFRLTLCELEDRCLVTLK